MALITVSSAGFEWPGSGLKTAEAYRDVSLSVNSGELVAIIGPSGCGKTTLLQTIAGLLRPTSGAVNVGDNSVCTQPLLLFQDAYLFPWLTVADNIRLGRQFGRGRDATFPEHELPIGEIIENVGLAGSEGLFPHQLSGGMKQRAALGRALANNPTVLLMDEPFSALDYLSRLAMAEFLLSIWRRYKLTIVFVTHSIDEAILLADRILVMSVGPGTIVRDIEVTSTRPRKVDDPGSNHLRSKIVSLLTSERV